MGDSAIRVAIVTVSDSASAGKREDLSGQKAREVIGEMNAEVVYYKVVPDEIDEISEVLAGLSDSNRADIILTTGGTGFSPRDNTPEATMKVIEKEIPGLPEAMRLEGAKKNLRAFLSRGRSGIRGKTLIINLPGSVKGVEESLRAILPLLPHAVEIARGEASRCCG